MGGITDSKDMSLVGLQELVMGREARRAVVDRVAESDATELELDWITNTKVGEGEREYTHVCAQVQDWI